MPFAIRKIIRAAARVAVLVGVTSVLLPAPVASAALPAPIPRYFTETTNQSNQYGPLYLTGVTGLRLSGAVKYEIWRKSETDSRYYRRLKTIAANSYGSGVFSTNGTFIKIRAIDSRGTAGAFSTPLLLSPMDPKKAWGTTYLLVKNSVSLPAYADAVKRFVKDRSANCAKDAAWNAAYNKLADVAMRSRNAYAMSAGASARFYKAFYDATFANNCTQIKKILLWGSNAAARTYFNSSSYPVNVQVHANWEPVGYSRDYCHVALLTSGGGQNSYQQTMAMDNHKVFEADCDEIPRRFHNAPS